MDQEWDRTGAVKSAQVFAGPIGFLLLLLLFLVFPMATASWALPEGHEDGRGSVSVLVSGADMVVGGIPHAESNGAFELPDEDEADMAREATPRGGARILGIAVVVVMGFGLLMAFVRVWHLRAIITAAVAAVAAATMVIAELLMENQLEDLAQWLIFPRGPQGTDPFGAGWGFWVTLVGLALIAIVNGFLLLEGKARQLSPSDEP
jgi:hypothetical protein